MSYIEQEYKILAIDPQYIQTALESLGAIKVFDGPRTFITFDTLDRSYTAQKKIIRLTDEGKLKLSISYYNDQKEKETVKMFTSRAEETKDFLAQLGFTPIAHISSHRISYEHNNIDYDIDIFPDIPPFLEVDMENSNQTIQDILAMLALSDKEIYTGGTEDLYNKYGKDYFAIAKV